MKRGGVHFCLSFQRVVMEGEHGGTSQLMSWLAMRKREQWQSLAFFSPPFVLSRPLVYGMVPPTFRVDSLGNLETLS